MKKYFAYMYSLTKGYRLRYLIVLILLSVSVFFTLISSYVSKIVVDCYSFTQSPTIPDIYYPDKVGPIGMVVINMLGGADFIMNNKWILAVAVVSAGVFYASLFIIRGVIRSDIGTGISKNIRLNLFYHIERLPYSFIKTHNNGDLLQTCMRDESTLRMFLSRQFLGLC